MDQSKFIINTTMSKKIIEVFVHCNIQGKLVVPSLFDFINSKPDNYIGW